MGIFNFFKHKEERNLQTDPISLMFSPYSLSSNALTSSAVYRCVEVISNAVAQMGLHVVKEKDGYYSQDKEHPAYILLAKEPNKYMSRFTLIKTAVQSMLLNGNAYIYINRDMRGNASELILLDATKVGIEKTPDGNIVYYFTYNKSIIESDNLIHIKNIAHDGITGISTLQSAGLSIRTSQAADKHSNDFFSSGASLHGVITTPNTLNEKQSKDIKESWARVYNSGDSKGIAVLGNSASYQPISVNPADAQLLESRKFSVIEICRFFGVSPIMAFDLEKSSYSTVEATSLAFLQETIQPILENIELELYRKIFKPSEKAYYDIKFNTEDYIKADKQSTAAYYSQLFQMGVLTTNEIRQKLGFAKVEKGDQPMVQANVVPLGYTDKSQLDNNLTK